MYYILLSDYLLYADFISQNVLLETVVTLFVYYTDVTTSAIVFST